VKRVQANLLRQLHTAIPDSDALNDVARRFLGDSWDFFKALYECNDLVKLDFWLNSSNRERSVSALVDSRESILADCSAPFNAWRHECDVGDSVTLGPKYLIHTQLYSFIGSRMLGQPSQPVEWDFTGWTVGLG